MCGINGIIMRGQGRTSLNIRISNMNAALFHRGPDAGGIYISRDDTVALGHRRLSIIDTDKRSTQPMVSLSGRWVLIYNGEIYNYQKLKQDLDYAYRTESDTEVILAGLENAEEASGNFMENFLEKCNGMFAFAAYDTWKKKLYLCRDRLGIKPLYYYKDETKFIFSSEIKGILHSGLVEAVLDEESIDDYLGYRYVREPYTFFSGIRQLEAGCYLCVDANLESHLERYWDIPLDFNMDENYDEGAIKEDFKKRLEGAVVRRTIADVPLGTYLSGGIDSSVLSAIVAGKSREGLNTYTIGFPEKNEFYYSDMVAGRYHTNHHKILMTDRDYVSAMEEVISYKDAPLGVPNEIPLAAMSRELKKDITVVLSGEGADELLGGYGRIFRSPFEYENSTRPAGEFYDFFIGKYEYVPRSIRDKYLKKYSTRRDEFDRNIRDHFRRRENEYNVFWFFHKYHVKGLLQRVDTTTMLASVEARVPFLDHKLVEFSYKNIPYGMKLRWKDLEAMEKARAVSAKDFSEKLDMPKYVLRELAYDYLPEEVITRKKEGFPVPLGEWDDTLWPLVRGELENAGWLDFKNKGERPEDNINVDSLIEDCGKLNNGNQLLWMFLNVQLFIKKYFSREWRYSTDGTPTSVF